LDLGEVLGSQFSVAEPAGCPLLGAPLPRSNEVKDLEGA
jgi:hypothetical protein